MWEFIFIGADVQKHWQCDWKCIEIGEHVTCLLNSSKFGVSTGLLVVRKQARDIMLGSSACNYFQMFCSKQWQTHQKKMHAQTL